MPLYQALRQKKPKQTAISAPYTFIAPTKGWVPGANLAEAPPGTCPILTNWFPQLDYVRVRGGSIRWATGMPSGTVASLLTYKEGNTEKMLAATNGQFYDVSSNGAVGAPLASGFSSDYWEFTQFEGFGNITQLFAANGVDPLQIYDGTGFNRTVSFTGTTASSINVTAVSSTAGLFPGMIVSASNLPAGTSIVDIPSSTTLTLSDAATTSASGVAFTGYINSPLGYGFTGNTNTSTLITNVNTTSGLQNGQLVRGFGVPAGATITNVGVNTVTLSLAATSSTVDVSFTAYGDLPVFQTPWIYKGRLYLIEINSLNVWYGGLASIGGALTLFPLGSIFKLGGSLVAGATWAVESFGGQYDSCAFITSEGEVAVYSGGWPGDSAWTLVGVYKIAKPLGRRCAYRSGGDLLILTQDGIVPASKITTVDQIALENVSLTQNILPVFRDAVTARPNLLGWQIQQWPIQSYAIVNIPKANSLDYQQFVTNVRTGAWALNNGWDANCFAVFQDQLFYGDSSGNVLQAEIGGSDDGNPYVCTLFPAFADCGSPEIRKDVKLSRAQIQSNPSVLPQITIKTDFDLSLPNPPSSTSNQVTGPLWDVALWDVSVWGNTLVSQNAWVGATGNGYVISPVLQVTMSSVATPDIRLTTTAILFENGSPIG